MLIATNLRNLCLLVRQTVNGRAPSYLQDVITPSVSVPRRATLRSASHHDLVLQSSHRKLGDRAFSVAGPRVWNSLPIKLKSIIDTSVFFNSYKNTYCIHLRQRYSLSSS